MGKRGGNVAGKSQQELHLYLLGEQLFLVSPLGGVQTIT